MIRPILFKWIPGIGFAAFVMGRLMLFLEELSKASKEYEDDVFTDRLCQDNNIKANLGKNMIICDSARVNLHISPWQTALKRVMSQTHLCGDTSCVDYFLLCFETMTASLNGILFFGFLLLLVCLTLPFVANRMSLARARRKCREQPLPMHSGFLEDMWINGNYKED